jgi:hypothetical protein
LPAGRSHGHSITNETFRNQQPITNHESSNQQ